MFAKSARPNREQSGVADIGAKNGQGGEEEGWLAPMRMECITNLIGFSTAAVAEEPLEKVLAVKDRGCAAWLSTVLSKRIA